MRRLSTGPDDLRDDVAGALDDHRVADADVLAADVVLVVQRRQLHGACRRRRTGSSTAKGLSLPVRPTLTSMSSSFVVACVGGNL